MCLCVFCVIPFRGQMCILSYCKEHLCLLWVVIYTFHPNAPELSAFYFTFPNSLLFYSMFIFIYLHIIFHCGQIFRYVFLEPLTMVVFMWQVTLLRKSQRSFNTDSLLPPLASIWIFSSFPFCQLPALSFSFYCSSEIHIQRCFKPNTDTTRANYNCAWILLMTCIFL